jgi:hypothetical protein
MRAYCIRSKISPAAYRRNIHAVAPDRSRYAL